MLNICQNGDQNRIQNEKFNEKAMQKDNAESGCAERLPKTGKGKEKEVMGRKSEAGGELWATPDGVGGGLPALKGGDLHLGPSPQSRHMSARFGKRAGICLHVWPKRPEE